MSNMALEVAPFCTRVLAPFYLRVSSMGLASFVPCFLHHAEDAVVAFDMVVGTVHIFPGEEDDHLFEFVFGQVLQRPGKEGVGLVDGVVDHARAAIARLLLGNSFVEEGIELLVETTEVFQLRGDLK